MYKLTAYLNMFPCNAYLYVYRVSTHLDMFTEKLNFKIYMCSNCMFQYAYRVTAGLDM